jgi:dihydropteroate synthase
LKNILLNGSLLDFSTPVVMGILNITPDSFFDGGKYLFEKDIKTRTLEIIEQGAGIIDLGAYSSRPGAEDVDEAIEYERLHSAFSFVRDVAPEFPVSIDCFRASIISKLYADFGGFIVNDVSGGEADKTMFETVAKYNLPYILMHIKGNPKTMQNFTQYKSLENDIMYYFAQKINQLHQLGLGDIIIDPGFGFSKNLDQNYKLMSILDHFKITDKPILVGISRKSMIYNFLNITPIDALNGTTVLNTIALQKGASFLRVHDVKEAVETVKIVNKLKL